MTFAGFVVAVGLLILLGALSCAAHTVGLRIAPAFFGAHHPETAFVFVVLLLALAFALFG